MNPVETLETAKATNPLKNLLKFGQSVWLDYIRRDLMTTGELKRLIEEDGLRGMTSNPAIFEKAISDSKLYDDILHSLAGKNLSPTQKFEALAIRDIQDAADALRAVFDSSKGQDGFVSLEVSPLLARDTKSTVEEARRLHKAVGRPNVMIKVPGTDEGVPAFQQLTAEGININVTLLFSQQMYEQIAEAYVAGLEQLAAKGGDVSKMASVASFFISRIDSAIDKVVEAKLKASKDPAEQAALKNVQGKVAIANGKLAYQSYQRIFGTDRWKKLAAKGAHSQRVLWASTSTKNPAYSDVMYIEELIGPDTVNTIPPATLDAYRDHGHPRITLTENIPAAKQVMESLPKLGISMKDVTDKLTDDGVKLFSEAFDKLLQAIEKNAK
jgi:transaldolase/transaldolase/glucose-6-phosphate isomerase